MLFCKKLSDCYIGTKLIEANYVHQYQFACILLLMEERTRKSVPLHFVLILFEKNQGNRELHVIASGIKQNKINLLPTGSIM